MLAASHEMRAFLKRASGMLQAYSTEFHHEDDPLAAEIDELMARLDSNPSTY